MLQQLNEEQLQAVTAPLGPVLVLAGAGSGKTRVLTNRIIYLVEELKVDPSNILAITFTNKAANEMKQRLWQSDCQAYKMHISTIHSFCATLLRREAELTGRNSNFSIYAEDEKKSVVKRAVKSVDSEADSGIVDSFCDSISRVKNDGVDVNKLTEGEICADENLSNCVDQLGSDGVSKVLQEYSKQMTSSNALDFDDLLYYVYEIFSENPEILDKYSEKYKYILIDEFQDINRVQYNIFRLLAKKYRNIFVVGDDDQSIYGWRGADVRNILNFETHFPGAKIYKLQQNYRSTKNILNVANEIIRKNLNRYSKKLFTENGDGLKVQMYSAYNESNEAYYVLSQISGLRNLGYRLRDCAILMRVNALSRTFEQECAANRLAYKVFGGFKFYERKEIKDVLCYLKLIANPYDFEAFARAVNVPVRRGIGDATLQKVKSLCDRYGLSPLHVIADDINMSELAASARKKLSDFYAVYQQLCVMNRTMPLDKFANELVESLGFCEVYRQADEDDRAMNVSELLGAIKVFTEDNPSATLSDYMQSVSLMSDTDEIDDDQDYITIATIHAVKGLEFKAVFVVGLEEGVFPLNRSQYDISGSQEERRLMYVATTRAKERLFLTCAQSRFMYGRREPRMASKYFTEVKQLYGTPAASSMASQRSASRIVFPSKATSSASQSQIKSIIKDKQQQANAFKPDMRVKSPMFGEGTIVKCDNGIATVNFDSCGSKVLVLQFAGLEIVK